MESIATRNEDLVLLLMKKGADTLRVNKEGKTAIEMGRECRKESIRSLFLTK